MKFKHMKVRVIYFTLTESGDSYMCEDGRWYETDGWNEWESISDSKLIDELEQALTDYEVSGLNEI